MPLAEIAGTPAGFQLRAALGIVVLLGLAWVMSWDRRNFPWKTVAGGLALQVGLALFLLRTDWGVGLFDGLAGLVLVVFEATLKGSGFVFGKLVDDEQSWGFIFAVQALPAIVVFSSLSAVGYHLGVLQRIVMSMAWVMRRTLFISGAESLSAAGNVFLGQTEAPLLVRPYVAGATRSELNAIMIGGFATVQGSLIAVYATLLGLQDGEQTAAFARHLLTASLISAPAGVVIAKILLPERQVPETLAGAKLETGRAYKNTIDAAATGAADGLKLALNVAAMLIAFLALIELINYALGGVTTGLIKLGLLAAETTPLSLQMLLGWVFYGVAWLIGARGEDCGQLGSVLGLAMATNEFIAYDTLRSLIADEAISPRTANLAVYALCGFANFSSIAIQIGGIGGMATERRGELAQLGLRAMLGGAMACWMTACLAGLLGA